MTAGNGKHPSCSDLHVLRSSRSRNLFFKKDAAREEMRVRCLYRISITRSCLAFGHFFFFFFGWQSCWVVCLLVWGSPDAFWHERWLKCVCKARKSAMTTNCNFLFCALGGTLVLHRRPCIFYKTDKTLFFWAAGLKSLPLIKLIPTSMPTFCPGKDGDYKTKQTCGKKPLWRHRPDLGTSEDQHQFYQAEAFFMIPQHAFFASKKTFAIWPWACKDCSQKLFPASRALPPTQQWIKGNCQAGVSFNPQPTWNDASGYPPNSSIKGRFHLSVTLKPPKTTWPLADVIMCLFPVCW